MANLLASNKHEQGFALVTVLTSMLILVFLGIAAMITSTTEVEIAGAEKIYKNTFYQADNGTSLAAEILEQNLNCPNGFAANVGVDAVIGGRITVLGPRPAPNTQPSSGNPPDPVRGSRAFWQNVNFAPASETNRDMYYAPYDPVDIQTPYVPGGEAPHTNFSIGGNTVAAQGSALQMAAGYEGKGKGEAGGGAHILYRIFSEHQGLLNSRSLLLLQWRHVVGTEGDCAY